MDTVDWQNLLFEFRGRINRAKFWLGGVTLYLFQVLLIIIAFGFDSGALMFAIWVILILTIWPSLAIAVKRWHDRGKSGWWVLIGLIPFIGFWWVLIECGFLPGDEGPNEYGPDPLAPTV